MKRFDKLFEVRLKHLYYHDEVAKDVTVVPTAETSRLMQDNRLLFRAANNGFFVAGETAAADAGTSPDLLELKRELPPDVCFRFHLITRNRIFSNITRLPVPDSEADIIRFDNRQDSTDGDALLLHPGSHAGDDATPVARLKDGLWRYNRPATNASGSARVLDYRGREILKQTVEAQNGELEFGFDLTPFPAGFYTLWEDQNAVETRYHTNEWLPGRLNGVIEIKTGDHAAPSHRLLDEDDHLNQPVYEIHFDQQATYWRYHIYNRSDVKLGTPVIEAGSFTFQQQSGGGATDPLVFESQQAIPLKEHGISGISLRRQTGNATHLVLDDLPNPDISFSEPDPADPQKHYSDIFIYL